MKKYVMLLFVTAIALMLVLCGCSDASSDQGELQLDARVTEAPVESTEVVQITVDENEAKEPAISEQAQQETAAESETTYAEALCAAFAATGAIDSYAPYSDIDILDYYGIDVAQCTSAVAYVDTEGYACELVIVEADETLAAEIEALLSEYLDARYGQFESYDADAAQLVKDAVMRRDGGIVLMIVAPRADELLSIYRSFEF